MTTTTPTTYKGDSAGKKIQRLRTWLHMWNLGQKFLPSYRGSLVLAGHGGDVDVLSGLGFPTSSITAVDLDPKCLALCREKHPGLPTLCADVGEIASRASYNMAHIDFCGTFSVRNLRTLCKVMWGFEDNFGLLAVTFMKGRERKGTEPALSHIPTQDRKQLLRSAQKNLKRARPGSLEQFSARVQEHMASNQVFDPNMVITWAESFCEANKNKIGYADVAYARHMALREALFVMALAEAKEDGLCVQNVGTLDYHSRSEESQGTPFFTACFIVGSFRKHSHRVQQSLNQHRILANMRDSISISEGLNAIPCAAVEVAEWVGVGGAAKVFGVPASTVVAWKAHASRGTYSVKPVLGEGAVIDIPANSLEDFHLRFHPVRLGEPLAPRTAPPSFLGGGCMNLALASLT